MKNNLLAWAIALSACAPFSASAQPTKTESSTAPAQLTYRSAFADYKPYEEAPLADWREVNAAVARAPGGASGHAGHDMGAMGAMGAKGAKVAKGGGMTGMKGMEMPAAPAPAHAASAPMKMPMKPMAMPMPLHDGHSKMGGKP